MANDTNPKTGVSGDTSQDKPKNKGGRPREESIKLSREARRRLDTLAAENADRIFDAILGAALGGCMQAARMLADRIWPSRRGAPITFTPPVILSPADVPTAYAWLLNEVATGVLSPEEGGLIDAMIERRAKAFEVITMAAEIEDLRAQLHALTNIRLVA